MRIEDVKTPTVGQVYNVPFVDGEPVCGNPHTDNEFFNSTPYHWHIDTRFSNSRLVVKGDMVRGEAICLRTRPLTIAGLEIHQMALYAIFEDRYGSVCDVCPHKGMPIHEGVCSAHRINWQDFVPPFYVKIGHKKTLLQDTWNGEKFTFRMAGIQDPVKLFDSQNQLMVSLDMNHHDRTWRRGDTLIIHQKS